MSGSVGTPALNVDPCYDPVTGPFLAIVDEHGALVDKGVVTNAVRSWAGEPLSAFSLCFQPAAAAPIDWDLAFEALETVSRELRARGAQLVVVHGARVCGTPPFASLAGKPHVEILGVIRNRDGSARS